MCIHEQSPKQGTCFCVSGFREHSKVLPSDQANGIEKTHAQDLQNYGDSLKLEMTKMSLDRRMITPPNNIQQQKGIHQLALIDLKGIC